MNQEHVWMNSFSIISRKLKHYLGVVPTSNMCYNVGPVCETKDPHILPLASVCLSAGSIPSHGHSLVL